MATQSLVVFLLLAATLATVACGAPATDPTSSSSTCPWRTVAKVDDPSVQGYGSYALMHSPLGFIKVDSATAQAVGDCGSTRKRNYALVLEATQRPGGQVLKYQAVVYVEDSKPIKLISLTSVSHRPPTSDN